VSAPPQHQTARWLEFVYGDRPDPDDPAEAYHEASKLTPSQLTRQMKGARRLDARTELRLSSTRAVRRHWGVKIPIATPASLAPALGDVITCRRSRRDFGCEPVAAEVLAALLDAGYGVTGALESPDDHPPVSVRAVPSGGALYPLELYAAVLRVDGLRPGLYHFDPLSRASRSCSRPDRGGSRGAVHVPRDRVLVRCASARRCDLRAHAVQVRPARLPFASSRRVTVAQNIVLAATALELAAVPLGAFYDHRADAFLGLDGVNESTLYTIAVGREQT
jgi:nitroreductase